MVDSMRDSAAIVAARRRSDMTGIDIILELGDTRGIVLNLADQVIAVAAVTKLDLDKLLAVLRAGGTMPDD